MCDNQNCISMKTTLLVVGRTVEQHYITAINDYIQRTKRFISFDMEVIPELKNTKSLSMEQQKEKEGELICKALQPGDNFLTIEGKLDNNDFKLIRDYMPNLVAVDIAKTNATSIPDFTFSQKKYLLRIKLPHGLKVIGQRVFSNCGRLCGTVELPASVTAIEFGAFMGCDNLRHVVATGDKITTLGDNLFGDGVENKLIYK